MTVAALSPAQLEGLACARCGRRLSTMVGRVRALGEVTRPSTVRARPACRYVLYVCTGCAPRRRASDRAADVTSSGPRDLWNERLSLTTQWIAAGRPTPGAYRLTVHTHGQHTLWREEPTPASWTL